MGERLIGIDLGGTSIRGAVLEAGILHQLERIPTPGDGTVDEVLQSIYSLIDNWMDNSITAIGIGVPSVVDLTTGVVYNVQNIPSWKEVPLKRLMEDRYHIPVRINNDANCFALAEYHFGSEKNNQSNTLINSMIGLTIGTGLGAGIILNGRLYNGVNCGAGELGAIKYLDHTLEYYASGSFFENIHQKSGTNIFEAAKRGDREALALYQELGRHIGQAIKICLYAYDPEKIVLGGSVSNGYRFFQEAMFAEMQDFDYPKSLERLQVEEAKLENSGILGAAALYFDSKASS